MMNGMIYLPLLVPATALALHGALAHTVFRAHPPRSRQKAAAGVSVLNALVWVAAFPTPYFLWTASAFSFFYFLVWNCTETARRVRVLVSLYQGENLSGEAPYTPEMMIRERTLRLEAMGALRREGDRFYPRIGSMLTAAHFFRLWRRFFRCEELERYL